jgi:hypothetical protein
VRGQVWNVGAVPWAAVREIEVHEAGAARRDAICALHVRSAPHEGPVILAGNLFGTVAVCLGDLGTDI